MASDAHRDHAAPYFPAPGDSAYRAAAERPVTDAAEAPAPAPPRVVHRPAQASTAPSRAPGAGLTGEDLHRLAGTEPPLLARYPRVFGGAFAAFGGWAVWNAVNVLLQGGAYSFKGAVTGPFALLLGLYLLVAGCPLDARTGRPRSDWKAGAGAASVIGLGLGLALFAALRLA